MWLKRRINLVFCFLFFCFTLFPLLVHGQDFFCPGEGRDPFYPLIDFQGRVLIEREIDLEGMSLEGIMYSEHSPIVVINGEVLRQNEALGEYVILKIEREKVTLEKDGREYILKLEVD